MKLLASRRFPYILIALLATQSLWIALTARYPQAFDEQFHFGLIQLHAKQWLPFFTQQVPGADEYGAVVRDPSYLFHYLLSFPYRLTALVTSNEVGQIIVLRCINIALLCTSLPLFKRIGQRLGMSAALVNASLLIFVLLPVVPLLGAQINYYNLLVPLTALLILLCLQFQSQLKADGALPLTTLWAIALVCALGGIVHYPFLPLVVVAFIYIVLAIWRQRPRLVMPSWNWQTIAAIIVLTLSFGLFGERYLVNIARYHTPTPECDQVLSVAECQQYSPWLRNYHFAAMNQPPSRSEVVQYPGSWMGRVIEETVFAIGSGFNSGGIDVANYKYGTVDYWGARSLPVPRYMIIAFLILGVLAIIWSSRTLLKNKPLCLAFSFSVGLSVMLFLLNMSDYLRVGDIVGVHGRYLIPVFPVFIMIIAIALRRLLPRTRYLIAVFVVATAIFVLQGGGLVTYIVRSQPRWFWPQSALARTTNQTAQNMLKPIVIGSNNSR